MFMKSFEHKYTAWIDGLLPEDERLALEREVSPAEKDEQLKLRTLLQENLVRDLPNPDFFNSQILTEIARQTVRSQRRAGYWLGLPRLAWSGLLTVACGVVLFIALIPHGNLTNPRAGYVAEVLKTKTDKKQVTATVENRNGMTIIKLNGLQKLPDKDPGQ
jgi:hypothetical protein